MSFCAAVWRYLLIPDIKQGGYYLSRIKTFIVTLSVTSLSVPLFLYTPSVTAFPGFSGGYTGTLSGSRTCIAPRVNRALSADVSLSFSETDGSITGSGSFVDILDGGTGTIQMSGTIDNSGSVSGSLTLQKDRPATGSFSGSYNGSQLILSINYTETGFPGPGFCAGTVSGTLTHASAADIYVNPQFTPGTIITTPQILNTQVRAITSDLQQRINDIFRTIKLARQRGGAEGFPGRIPPGGAPPDQRKKKRDKDKEEGDDSQASLPVQRTQTGFMIDTLTGMNAGDTGALMGAWASYSYLDFNNDFAATAFDGQRHGGLAGLDIAPREDLLMGLSVGYENTDIDTDFNRGNQQTDGFTVAPYLGYLLTDTWSVSASFGYSSLNTDQFRTVPGTATRVTSSPDHDRWFAMLNLNGLTTYGNWVLGGQLGLLYALDAEDAFVESDGTQVAELDSRLGQFNVGGEAAYSLGEYEPFMRISYEYDLRQTKVGVIGGPQPSFDDDDVLLGGGLRYYGSGGLTGNLEFNTRLGRNNYDEYSLTGTIRYEW